ncbi:transcriptional regulator, AsnC family [Methylophaga aminisulfidivorans MP]|uniref:Transcriptional regulator, AsnC family n=1 Tax=Methylophaga aminisulfidivorans MP TaxID=1026882 RepID=F5T328_9GAMM|nr:Lrp/AsnC family transcriptional regulator [Methylophaga aminisulfidivorans]EGL53451.1 transcriptional regulator, AsnC family [Methylophaga aminisulfidivorans MP]
MSEQLDKYDVMILQKLQTDGRITNQELAEAIKLSPSPCLRRVKQMEEKGLIDGYVALLNAKKLGLTLMAFIGISMDKHTPERFEALESTLAGCPEVLECHLITGQSADYLLKVIVKDMDAYQQFLLNKLTRIEGVTGVHTSFVMKSPIKTTALPVS